LGWRLRTPACEPGQDTYATSDLRLGHFALKVVFRIMYSKNFRQKISIKGWYYTAKNAQKRELVSNANKPPKHFRKDSPVYHDLVYRQKPYSNIKFLYADQHHRLYGKTLTYLP
jgi:hypothetical protein